MGESIFTKIISGTIPCHKVYEDQKVFAFLDANPISEGHTLVVPKEPAPTLDRLSDDAAAAIGRVLPRIARAVLAATGASAFNVLQNNGAAAHQAVFHVHFHIIPQYPDRPAQNGLGLVWKPAPVDQTLARALAGRIAQRL